MKKTLSTLAIGVSSLAMMFGLAVALPSGDADAARWSKSYRTLSQCKTARNAALGSGYRGYLGKCQAVGVPGKSGSVVTGYKYKIGY